MATIDTSYVRRELRAIAAVSNAIRNLLRDVLEQIEDDPSAFEELNIVPERIRDKYPSVAWRKIKIETGRHSYRLVVAHWRLTRREDHVDVLYAFPRKKGYPIDWDEVSQFLRAP